MAFWSAALPVIASLGSAALSAKGAEQQQETSMEIAQKQMDFQERMSNTAHVREVQDLSKAGLNPILSAGGGGASSPPGASGQAVDIIGQAARAGISTAMQTMRLDTELENMEADTKVKNETERLTRELQQKAMADTLASQRTAQNLEKSGKILDEDLATAKADAVDSDIRRKYLESDGGETLRQIQLILKPIFDMLNVGSSAKQMMRR